MMESKVEFLAVDMPDANRMTVHILAAVAEHEREMISQQTKAALAQAKSRGTKLGNPRAAEAAAIGRAAIVIPQPPPKVRTLIAERRAAGASLREIARELNQLGIRTPKGSQRYACTVRSQIAPASAASDPAYAALYNAA